MLNFCLLADIWHFIQVHPHRAYINLLVIYNLACVSDLMPNKYITLAYWLLCYTPHHTVVYLWCDRQSWIHSQISQLSCTPELSCFSLAAGSPSSRPLWNQHHYKPKELVLETFADQYSSWEKETLSVCVTCSQDRTWLWWLWRHQHSGWSPVYRRLRGILKALYYNILQYCHRLTLKIWPSGYSCSMSFMVTYSGGFLGPKKSSSSSLSSAILALLLLAIAIVGQAKGGCTCWKR